MGKQGNNRSGVETELMRAASEGRAARVRELLLDSAAEVNATDSFGNSALMLAASSGHHDVVEALLEFAADTTLTNRLGVTALKAAESTKHLSIVKLLKDAEAGRLNKEAPRRGGEPAHSATLFQAIQNEDARAVERLLREGVDVDEKTEDGLTALMLATIKGSVEIMHALLQRGADANQKNNKGWTALRYAVSMGDINALQVLLASGADVNVKDIEGKTALTQAVSENNVDSLKLLLSSNADVNVSDQSGVPALMLAGKYGYYEIIELLKKAGAEDGTVETESAPPDSNAPPNNKTGASDAFTKSELLSLQEAIKEFLPSDDAIDAILDINDPGSSTPTVGRASPAAAAAADQVSTQLTVPNQSTDVAERLIIALEALRFREAGSTPIVSISDVACKIMLTLPEAASLTNLSRTHLVKAIKEGKLNGKKIGRGWRVKRADLDEYIKEL